jgi:hypothetical protein
MPATSHKVNFLNHECIIYKEKYANNDRIALELVFEDPECGNQLMPMTTATINLPDEPCAADEVFIKDYSENEGLLEVLIEAGIISEPVDHVYSGFISAPKCKLLI